MKDGRPGVHRSKRGNFPLTTNTPGSEYLSCTMSELTPVSPTFLTKDPTLHKIHLGDCGGVKTIFERIGVNYVQSLFDEAAFVIGKPS